MTKLYHKGSAKIPQALDADALLASLEAFLTTCRSPAILEYGEEITRLTPGQYALEQRAGRVWIEVWCETRSISRRILAIERRVIGAVDCTVQRFGGKSGKLSFLDLDRPQSAHKTLCGTRQSFTEQFRRMLSRQFPGWEICTLSCGMDLQRSFSPVFPRARLKRGNRQLAALACPDIQDESALLTFALIWHHHVCAQHAQATQVSLCLFLPDTAGCLTAHRLRWVTGESLEARLFRFNAHGSAGEVDTWDLGNLQTRVSPHCVQACLSGDLSALLERLTAIDGVGYCPEVNGGISMRCRGLEFARIENGRLLVGIETKRAVSASHIQAVEELAAQISNPGTISVPSPAACMHRRGLQTFPERWLESSVRSSLSTIDASLLQSPVHGQVLTFAAGDRDLIDLLAVSSSGRLAVLELKASEDIHLPVQGLDYWMRTAWHAQSGELDHFFPGISLDGRPPRLLLVAPAICFHPSNASVLHYFSPDIEVERIGINSDWGQNLRVVLRLRGSDLPMSHRSSQ